MNLELLTSADPSAQTGAVLFADLCDYTRLCDERGDVAAAQMALALERIARDVAADHFGRVVKMLGDGAHLYFASADDAVAASLDLAGRIQASDLPCARIGVNAGPMVAVNGDYYGTTVNVAARIAAQAQPGDVLVGEAAATCAGAQFECLGPVTLRGVARQISVYRATAA